MYHEVPEFRANWVFWPRSNQYVQDTLSEAITALETMPNPKDEYDVLKRDHLISYLKLLKGYSASGNSIPGLGGLGLEQGMKLAHTVLDGNFKDGFRLDFKSLGKGFLF